MKLMGGNLPHGYAKSACAQPQGGGVVLSTSKLSTPIHHPNDSARASNSRTLRTAYKQRRPLIQLSQHQQEQFQPSLRRRRSLPQPPRLKTTRSPEAAIQFGPHHRLGSATAGARAVAAARRQLLFATGSHLFGTGQTSPPPATAAPPFQAEAPPITLATQLGADSGPTATTSTRSSL